MKKVNNAMSQVRLKGYGVVTPERSEIILDEPEVIKHGNKYGGQDAGGGPPPSI